MDKYNFLLRLQSHDLLRLHLPEIHPDGHRLRLRPFAGGEIFLGLGEDAARQNKFRLGAGLEYDVKPPVTLRIFYLFERDLSEKTNESFHIIGAKFNYSF